jgi:cytochrome d ubiquinol oxidase subunit II
MQTFATVLLSIFAGGYLILAGGDIGVGMLLPSLGRSPAERRVVIAAVTPWFLSNEVWLVAVAGLIVGAFPGLEHDLLYDQRSLVITLLLGWIVRDVGLWWRGRVDSSSWRAGCDGAIVLGSWTLALSLGGILSGSVLLAVPVALVIAWHGLGFARLRLTGAPLDRARWGRYPLTAVVLGALPVLAGTRLDLSGAAAGPSTLTLVTVFVAVLFPVLMAAQALVWWMFRDRVTEPGYL